MAEQDTPPPTITAMKIPIIKKGEYDIWSMRMRQYICHTDHNLWDIIVNGDLQEEPAPTGDQSGPSAPPVPKTAKQLAAKRNQERVKSILLLAIPDEYLLKFHNVPDAKSLWEAIKSSQDKAYDRFQKLISQLEVYAALVSKEDINQKFLRSLPPSWSQIALIMRNKPDIDQTDIDNLYNNLRVYEDEIKINTAGGTSSTSQGSSTPGANEVVCSFFAQQTTSPPLDNEDLQQIDQDDLEELDIRWQVAMITVRVQRFIQKTGRNLDFKGIQPVTFDKSKRNATTNEPPSQALVAQDSLRGYDWINDFDEPVNYALMAIYSSSLSSSFDNEGEKYEFQNYKLKCREVKIENLKMELEKVVKERDELKVKMEKWEESSNGLNKILNNQMSAKDNNGLGYGTQMDEMSNKSETDNEISMSVFEVRLSDEELTPANDRFSKADGYHVIPPPITWNFLTPRADISFTGLDEYAIRKKIIESKPDTSKSKTSETVDDENDVSEVSPVKTNETQIAKTQVDKIGQTSKKAGIGFKKIKSCFVSRRTFVPSGVLTRTGLVNLVRPNEKRAVQTINPARPVSTAKVNNMTTAGTRAVVSSGEGKMDNTVKKSRWVWRPKGNYIDHESKENGCFMLKKFEVNPEIFLQDHAVVDSGCSSHMTGNKAYLSDYEDYNGGFVAFRSDPKGGKITGKGKIKTANLDFDNVYFVDELKFNLFSVSQMCDKKNSVLFTNTECLILSPSFKLLDESQVVLRAPRKDDVYSLDLKNIVPSGGITCLYANATSDESKLWHRRLGHVNFKNINKLVKGHLVRGLPSKVFVNDYTCVACKKGKQHKASCKAKLERTIRKPLELLHMDLFGPVSVESINKKKYCLVVTDDFSRFSWVFFLATKDETTKILCKFIIGLENQLNHKVKIIRCDHGTEFKNYAMNEFCAKKGIKREFSMARTP
ncbi:putative ribonuclease H-like domain-containing protein [Tanacetum coccineum]|uniref:Ribonuclease H-like domain-containing protein n=1 Tax=Tanacetum coccineum TaxID=301880 RepID=A0ABQ5ADP9_9ASTR